MTELTDLNTRHFIDQKTGEFGTEEIGKKVKKHIDFSDLWQTTDTRPVMHPEPSDIFGQQKTVIGKTYSVKPFYEPEA